MAGFWDSIQSFIPETERTKMFKAENALRMRALQREEEAAAREEENLLRQQRAMPALMNRLNTSGANVPEGERTIQNSIFSDINTPTDELLGRVNPQAAFERGMARAYPVGEPIQWVEPGKVPTRGGRVAGEAIPGGGPVFKPTNMQIPGTDQFKLARTQEEYDAYAEAGFVEAGAGVPGKAPTPNVRRIVSKEEAIAAGLPEGGTYEKDDTGYHVLVQPKQERATQGENTSAYHARRLATSLGTLGSILKSNPKAATSVIGGNNFASKQMRSEDENRVQAALPEIGDALLTLGTGAAYTEAQFQNQWQSNLPAIGDSDKVLADKFGRIQALYEQAKSNAGPLAKDLPDLSSIAAIFEARAAGKKPSAGREGWSIRKNG